jgi:hypothetical protein
LIRSVRAPQQHGLLEERGQQQPLGGRVSHRGVAASASIAADPVSAPATAFITAIKALATSATMTVSVLSPLVDSPSSACS